ncbi:MAG: serine hydrolase domain-containing protein [Actinomycetota bacterium]
MRPNGLRPLIAALALGLMATSCSSSSSESDVSEPTTAAPTSSTTTPAAVGEVDAAAPDTATPEIAAEPVIDGPFAEIGPIVSTYVADNELNGAGLIVVHRDDGVLLHEHWGEFSEDRISLIASSSKMVTAGVLLHLQDDGLLDIDAPIAEVAEWGSGNPDITTAQLLSNSSGLIGLATDPLFLPYLCMFDPDAELEECGAEIFTTDGDDGAITAPDTNFDYGGAQWQVAGAVAEVASGRSWAELVDEIYVEPCGLETLAYNNHFGQLPPTGFSYPTAFEADPAVLRPTENPNLEGGAYVTTGDYGELLLMQLRDGRCGDTQVLSPESLATMHGDRIGEVYDGDAYADDTGYGMGWWVDRETGIISDPGAYGSVAWLDLDDGYGAFLVVESTGDVGGGLADLLEPVVDAAVAAR